MVAAAASWIAAKATAAFISVAGSTSLAAAQAVHAVAYYGAQIAIGAAAAAALRAAQGTPDAESVKGSKRQAIPPRIRAYGYRKLGGYYLLWEAQANYAYDVVYFAEGPCQGGPDEEIWSHDHVLAVMPDGWVVGDAAYGGGANDLIHVETRRGLPTETSYPAIVAAMSAGGVWTTSHRGDALSTLGADYHHAKKENLLDDYPQGDPSWSKTSWWSLIWDPRDPAQDLEDWETWTGAHANLGLQILDFCCHPMGMAMDFETEIAPALDHWKGEFDICDEDIPLAAGGTEKRYWGSSYYAVPADPQEHLDRLLAACDGKLLKDQHGVWRLWVGKYRPPVVHLSDVDIAAHDLSGDAAAFDLANVIVPKFVDPAQNWTLVDTTEWRDQAAIDLIGRLMSTDLALEASNSGPMSRRVVKAVLKRNGSPLRGSITGRLSAAEALGQRWISADLPDLGLEGVVLEMLDGGRLAFSRGAVDLNVTVADPAAYDWDAATEEAGTELATRPPIVPLTPPTIDSITPFTESLGGAEGQRLQVEGSGPDRDDLTWYVRWRPTGTTSWQTEEITDDAAGPPFSGATGFVTASAPLDVELGYQTASSAIQWSATDSITANPLLVSLDFVGGTFRNGAATANEIAGLEGWAFSRSGLAYGTWADGSLIDVPTDTPRITDLGLLIEAAGTNVCDNSQTIDAPDWNTGGTVTKTANHAVAPDGTTTADRIEFGAGASYLSNTSGIGLTNGQPCTVSFWAKAVSAPHSIGVRSGVSGTASIKALTTAWQRFSFTFTAGGTSEIVQFGDGDLIAGASTTCDFHLWGVQLEAGSSATSYVPTTTANVTRAADAATLTIPSGDPADEITVVWSGGEEILARSTLASPTVIDLGAAGGGAWVGGVIEAVRVAPA